MTSTRPPLRSHWSIGTIVLLGLGAGLLAGEAEVAIKLVRRYLFGSLSADSRDIVWLVPLTTGLALTAIALLLGAAGAAVKSLRRPVVPLVLLGWLAGFSVLRFVPQLSDLAVALVAAGIVVQGTRVVLRREAAFLRFLPRATAVLVAAWILTGGGSALRWRLEERRATAALAPLPASAPNVLLLVLDTVRAWELSAYGYRRPTTPNLERRAGRAVVFERAYSESPWTLPSHAAMFTGRRPAELSAGWFTPLDDRYPTVAEAMRNRGYLTGGFVANQVYTGRESGLARGFIHYADHSPGFEEALRSVALLNRSVSDVLGHFGDRNYLARKSAGDVNHEFLAWVDRHPGRPFFAFLNYFDAHTPYHSPDAWRARFRTLRTEVRLRGPNQMLRAHPGGLPASILTQLRDGYDASIGYLDAEIEDLFRSLESRGLLDRTVVILTSDHGELLGEYGLIDHGNSLYPPLLHVPLIVWDPRSKAGRRVAAPVSTRNVAATILDLAAAGGDPLPGTSLASYWADAEPAPVPEPIMVSLDDDPRLWWTGTPINKGDMRGMIADSMLYIANGDASEEVYRIWPREEEVDLTRAPEYRDLVAGLRTRFQAAAPPRRQPTAVGR